ncbi:MAG: hypothetical protein SGI99_13420 [Pseudomonadota bacterium]|nr:hypothetical protein [Pseudomonadota bacterium]
MGAACRFERDFGVGCYAQFAVDVFRVTGDGVLGQRQGFGDLPHGVTLGDQSQHFIFEPGEVAIIASGGCAADRLKTEVQDIQKLKARTVMPRQGR